MVFKGERAVTDAVIGFLLPACIGNSVGGVAFMAALAHAHAPEESS